MNLSVSSESLSSSGTFYTGMGILHDFLVGGTDYLQDVIITIYDSTVASGKTIVPTAKYDASQLGLNGAIFHVGKPFDIGCYVEITTSGTVSITGTIEGRV